ncbi:MAG: protease HtpX, partial [Thermodesulfobacteria bacterium]|nr:protease HtpX [Thermodesulfobacteriota bacterium]
MSNVFKTFILLAGLTALFMLVGRALGGQHGMMVALFFAAVMNFFAYWFSDKMALSMSGAQPVSEAEAPELHAIVASLAARAGLPKPKVYIIPTQTPNA